jgi:predicted Rdx family selenoprotein
VSVTKELLTDHQHRIESLTLVTGSKGVFDVDVDGETIYSKATTGRKPEPGEVLSAFEAHLRPGFRRYGS